ncbi:MAG: hypothetical protein P1V97_26695 [Planctomycetota bacterium]|nr:hypothetical protein [Planctomycetota bacterium]
MRPSLALTHIFLALINTYSPFGGGDRVEDGSYGVSALSILIPFKAR